MGFSKGDWIADLRPGARARGFFFLSRGRPTVLRDASGALPLLNANPQPGECGPVLVTGVTLAADGMHGISPRAIVPIHPWTGSPFAIPPCACPARGAVLRLHRHLESIPDPETRLLLTRFFSDPAYMQRFLTAPASLNHHHARPGGLAEHTAEVLDTLSLMAARLNDEERSLVSAAAMLHDAGKAFEYRHALHLSPRGRLIGHETTLIERLAPFLDTVWPFGHPKRLLLIHLLTAKPAPAWTGIRSPRTELCALLRFADRWSIERDLRRSRDPSIFQPGKTSA